MKRVLILLPKSIAGTLILEGLAFGFIKNKCLVIKKDINDISAQDIKDFRPDMVIGYDYSFLMDEKCTKIIKKSKCKNLVFYFADEPKGKFALLDKDYLYNELKKIKKTVFVWDNEFLNEFEGSYHLPLAVNPTKYLTDFIGYKYDISFVGRPFTDIRQEILSKLVKVYKNKLNIFCYEEHFLKSIEEIKEKKLLDEDELEIYSKCWKGFIKTEEELAKIYTASKVNLNITLQGKTSINYRVFEVLASGGFLLTDEREDLEKLFTPSKHLETYKNIEDLIDKIDFYMKNLNIAQKIARLGKYEVIQNHNFSARAKLILEKVF